MKGKQKNNKNKPVCVLKDEKDGKKIKSQKKEKKSKLKCSDDEDGGPDEVTFKEGLEKMLNRKKMIIEKLEDDEERLKAKRKRQDELYKEQKKKKLNDLEQMKLPDEVLESVDNDLKKSKKCTKIKTAVIPLEAGSDDEMEEDDEDAANMHEVDEKNDDMSVAEDEDDVDEDVDDKEEEFIPLSNNGVKAKYSMEKFEDKSSIERAMNFKNQHLFGSRIRRQTAQQYLSVLAKRKARRI